jgi:ricin-type beta-trefoil lectin protein
MRFAMALFLVGASLSLGTGMASADSVQTFRNRATNQCLDDSNEYGLRTFPCNGLNYQKWNVHRWNDGTLQIRNIHTGGCLGVYKHPNGTWAPEVGTCKANQRYSWYSRRVSGGIRLWSEAIDTRCLWGDGQGISGGRVVKLDSCLAGYEPSATVWF